MITVRGVLGLAVVVTAIGALAIVIFMGWRVVGDPEPLITSLVSRLDSPADPGDTKPRSFTVPAGQTAAEIADRLQEEGLISESLAFRMLAQLQGVSAALEAGEYELSPSMRPSQILDVLAGGKTKPAPLVTIPEGWRAEEIAERLAAHGIGSSDQFMLLVREGKSSSPALASRPSGTGLEGYLFPDSYSFDSRTTMGNMVERMIQQFESRFTPEMRKKADNFGMSIHEAVTLASIIEREAVIPSERPIMAGVFHNRLRQGMRLDADPTVQYALASQDPQSRGLYGWWKIGLNAVDLEIDSPYNSYRYTGLPPGPICNPGLASLLASIEPEQTDHLYFVARPDGSHAFSRTLEEHYENVALFRQ